MFFSLTRRFADKKKKISVQKFTYLQFYNLLFQFGKRVHSNSNGGRNDVIGPSGDAGRERMSSMQISLINNARNSIISLFNGGGRKRESDDGDNNLFHLNL